MWGMNLRAQIAALLPHTMELLGVYQGMSTGEIRKQDGVDDRFARIMPGRFVSS
ncbi:hypothetical protein HMPREF0293_2374 [Corynebacterium glucuronolyticum ATCC 51866]|uniref:Uncharacterized protein n=2 Tax=Corynebacterium glucuronolyticum TaxID=39791 RepID=A0ABP2DQF7_9CORY|nr:hypothetical protein HMPREF0293_2374 [Corynebacterium glucuronolyticum ATCC 51866]